MSAAFKSANRKVIITGVVMPYEAKAPYVESGKSILGALELDATESTLKCHECGEPYAGLAYHVGQHGISPREYRRKHGLRHDTHLQIPKLVARRAAKARTKEFLLANRSTTALTHASPSARLGPRNSEAANLAATCREQLRKRIRSIADELGRQPSISDLRARGISAQTAKMRFHVKTMDRLMEACGLSIMPAANRVGAPSRYSPEVLIELLRDARSTLGRVPTTADCGAPLLPSSGSFQSAFGSWRNALKAAGFGLVTRNRFVSQR